MNARVLVSIVSYNSDRHLRACLESIRGQTFRDLTVSLLDNASSDSTPSVIERCRDLLDQVHLSEKNQGFCAAHNRLILSALSEYILVLNPDVVLDSRFVEILVREMERNPRAGSATGKLLRLQAGSGVAGPERMSNILDSTGFYLTRNQRHLDRGSGEIDTGQYERQEYVFGASGAAALYRRAMLEDIRDKEEFFDERFFAYREDADLAWRAQWLGWRCIYIPEAKAYHERRVLPERRAALPGPINMHSFKNRFLLRVKNMDCGTYFRFFLPVTLRDFGALAYILLREQSSLRGVPLLFRALPRAWASRRRLMKHRRVSANTIRSWFYKQSEPLI
jgi:GT2 family glycosyltransferase